MPNNAVQVVKTTRRRRTAKPKNAVDVTTTTTTVKPVPAKPVITQRRPPSNAAIRKMARPKSLLTPAGRAWLRLYLNPMARDDSGIIGYPDGAASRSVLADYREDFHFTMPACTDVYLSGSLTANPDSAKWKDFSSAQITVLFLQLPVLEQCILVRIYKSTPTTFVNPDGVIAREEAPKTFPQYEAFADDGSAVGVNDPIGFVQTLIKLDNIGTHAKSSMGFRLIARGNTFIYTVPKLEEQGFVTSAQFDAPSDFYFARSQVADSVDYDPTTPPQSSNLLVTYKQMVQYAKYVMRYGNFTPTALVECFHNAYTSKAVDGAYVPIYNTERDLKYQLDYDKEVELMAADESEKGNLRITDTPVKGWNMAVTWFENISVNASIKIKHRSVVQLVAAPGSQICNFTRHEPDEDQLALETAWKVRNKMAHAYPAVYNDWGWLGAVIDNTLRSLPYVGPLYGAVKPLIKPSWDWLGDRAKDWLGTKINLDQ